jgi:hypothetical protein
MDVVTTKRRISIRSEHKTGVLVEASPLGRSQPADDDRCSRAPGRLVRALTQCIPHSDFSNTSQEPLMPISLA